MVWQRKGSFFRDRGAYSPDCVEEMFYEIGISSLGAPIVQGRLELRAHLLTAGDPLLEDPLAPGCRGVAGLYLTCLP
jgi:hypothetical protein